MRLLPRRALLASMASTMTTPTRALVVDSHLHVWSSTSAFAPGKEPPANLGDAVASAEAFAAACQESGVDRALIVQPINYLFDHTYVAGVLAENEEKYRGMALADPSQTAKAAAEDLRAACATAPNLWTGVRFNPYLWPEQSRSGAWLADDVGTSLADVCAELKLPIGVMAFGGFSPLVPSIEALCARGNVDVVIDHWGFPRAEPGAAPSAALKFDKKAFGDLCALGRKHNNLYLKLSAHFRVSSQDAPHTDLQPRFDAAVDAFGADRLMWGSDFPFVQLNGGQKASLEAVRKFSSALAPEARDAILGGTARRLFRLP